MAHLSSKALHHFPHIPRRCRRRWAGAIYLYLLPPALLKLLQVDGNEGVFFNPARGICTSSCQTSAEVIVDNILLRQDGLPQIDALDGQGTVHHRQRFLWHAS